MAKKITVAIFSVLALSTALTVCNTTRGAGENISDGDNMISGAATKAQQWAITVRWLCRAVCFFCGSYIGNS